MLPRWSVVSWAVVAGWLLLGAWSAVPTWAVPGDTTDAPAAAPAAEPATPSPERAAVGFGMPADFRAELFAAEPDLANPVAFTVDERGRVFVCETFRQNKGVSDNRGQKREWVDADLASQSVADREAYHRRLLGDEVAEWEKHDDRVRLLVDDDGDGKADRSSVYAEGFNRLIDGTAAGLLARRGDLFLTCIPALYRLRDLDGDGRIGRGPPEREIISEGYGCRVAYRGHDLHGLVIGPDGKLYFSIGDRGYRVEHADGVATEPGRGAVFRCNPDGSGFEVFATGLRNPQELAFDDLGNLFTVDNNCDGGDKARLVHLVPGGDSGWTMEYQYLADRGPWNRERMWELPHEGQPLWLVPPLAHLGAGPSGLAAYPGTGLPARFNGRFLLCDFRGGAANSCVRSFALEPAGGSFRVSLDEETFRGVLATDVEFGPDGAVWVSDWVHGWMGEGLGRIWRFVPEDRDEQAVAEVRTLLAADWAEIPTHKLQSLLGHADRRLRLEAQWELVRRGKSDVFQETVHASGPLLPRVHALWGLAALSDAGADAEKRQSIVGRLADDAWQIRAVACRMLGDLPRAGEPAVLLELAERLADPEPQVRVAAGIAVGRLGHRRLDDAVVERVLVAAARDAEADGFLRHGVVSAVAAGFSDEQLGRAATDSAAAVRLTACLAMRRRHDPRIVAFLDDTPRIAAEAVRAIHDLPMVELFPSVAARLAAPGGDRIVPELGRRMVSAAERLGTPAAAGLLAAAAADEGMPIELRVMAVDALADWAAPPDRNRVDGRWQPHASGRDPAIAWAAFKPHLPRVLVSRDRDIRRSALAAIDRLAGTDVITMLVCICRDETWEPTGRGTSLEVLARRDPAEAKALATALRGDRAWQVRAAARRVLAATEPAGVLAEIEPLIAVDSAAGRAERQAAVELLADIQGEAAAELVARLADQLEAGSVDPALSLEVREVAAERLGRRLTLPGSDQDPLAAWGDVLAGGESTRGREVFFGKVEASCVRCHRAEGTGGEVGPALDGIGGSKDIRYLLESIVLPNARVADGFQTTIIVTDEGRVVSGIVVAEDAKELTLRTADGELARISVDSIDDQAAGPSSMPADLAGKLSRRELRDLVAWLATLRAPAVAEPASGPAAAP